MIEFIDIIYTEVRNLKTTLNYKAKYNVIGCIQWITQIETAGQT